MCTGSVYQIKKYCQKNGYATVAQNECAHAGAEKRLPCGLMGMVIFFLTINRYNIISDVYFQKQD